MPKEHYFEQTSTIVNGYWYSFEYHPSKVTKDFDRFPLIYCIAPSTHNLNCFVGLNVHRLPISERVKFLINFDKLTHFREGEKRRIVSENTILKLNPGCQDAIRIYNKINIINPIKLYNKSVPLFIDSSGDIMLSTPSTIMNKYFLDLTKNKTDENKLNKNKTDETKKE